MTSIRKTTTLAALLFAATAMARDAYGQQCANGPCPASYGQPYGYTPIYAAPATAMVPVRCGLSGRRIAWVARYQAPQVVPYAAMSQAAQPATNPPGPAIASPGMTGGGAAAFLAWLNGVRGQYGLPAVEYSAVVEADCHQNNLHQAARGMNHWYMGCHRRQNAAWNLGFPGVESAWMGSPGHSSALLDPTIRFVGIAWLNGYCTFGAN